MLLARFFAIEHPVDLLTLCSDCSPSYAQTEVPERPAASGVHQSRKPLTRHIPRPVKLAAGPH